MSQAPPEQPAFLDVDALLDRSQPALRGNWFWYAVGVFLLIVMVSAYVSTSSPTAKQVMDVLSPLVTLGLLTALAIYTLWVARRHRAEGAALEAIEELVQLRRFAQAAGAIESLLYGPPRSPGVRAQAMLYLGGVLARYHRFDDAVRVFEHLLDHVRMDDATAEGVRLGRAMALLREDRLTDANRAIDELRRTADREVSAALALVEMYRAVKTGHPDDATAIFEQRRPMLRDRLGFRVADVYALAARAYDMMMLDPAKAAAAWARATALAPVDELLRRYPELRRTADTFPATTVPDATVASGEPR